MKTYEVVLTIRAECESDAEELMEEYLGDSPADVLEIKHRPSEDDPMPVWPLDVSEVSQGVYLIKDANERLWMGSKDPLMGTWVREAWTEVEFNENEPKEATK